MCRRRVEWGPNWARNSGSRRRDGAHRTSRRAPVGFVEVAGRVKWFDAAKGYGFIVPDSGEADVLIHVTVLRRDGFSTIREGARVVAEANGASAAFRCSG